MKIDSSNIKKIRILFFKMKSKEDFLVLINLAKFYIYADNAVQFQMNQLNYYAFKNANKNNYHTFIIKKKSGLERIIHAPVQGLKILQGSLSFILQCVFSPNECVMGFVRDKSIVHNAAMHVGSNYVYNIDLKDFFISIDQARFWKCLHLWPFGLKGEKQILANMIASICCATLEVERKNQINGEWEKVTKNVLPQGAPTSPVISNIVCRKLDYLLSALAIDYGLKYSRYADDITFSSDHNVYQNHSIFLKNLNEIIVTQGFWIQESKTRLQKNGSRKEVTGLVINEKVNVKQRYIKELRKWLYYWERYGYIKASNFFSKSYTIQQTDVKNKPPNMNYAIKGKLDYLKMVKGSNNNLYLKLKNRYLKLVNKNNPSIDKELNNPFTIVEE